MNSLTKRLLDTCLKKCNKPDGLYSNTIRITESRFKFYHQELTAIRLETHRQLEQLQEKIPEFSLQYLRQGFDAVPILDAISINNPRALCELLGMNVIYEEILSASAKLRTELDDAPSWLTSELANYQELWEKGRRVLQFGYAQSDKLTNAVRFAKWLTKQCDCSLDYRTASVRALGNSKYLEGNLGSIAAILQLQNPQVLTTLEPAEVLGYFGIASFPPLLRISGTCQLQFARGNINSDVAKPYLCMPADAVCQIRIKPHTRYILLIENLSAFERYTREIDDNGLVIFTNGFPSRHLIKLLRVLINTAGCPTVYHWGDIDVGGYRIFTFLSQNLGEIIPYRMIGNPPGHSSRVIDINDLLSALDTVQTNQSSILRKRLQRAKEKRVVQYWVEQELLDPISPISIEQKI